MNLLKALAKMTRYAARLENSRDILREQHKSLQEKYDDTARIATDRDTQIKQLQAQLHAAEQNTATNQQLTAVNKLNDLGYAWSIPDGRWFDPIPSPVGVPMVESDPGHAIPADWPLQATHYLFDPSTGNYAFAEFHEGEYYALLSNKASAKAWEWSVRATFVMGEQAWGVVGVRK